jgi:non-specific protein-tyrosine kinase
MHGAAYGDVPEMTMRDYWRVVVRRKWLVVLAVVVTVAGAGAMVAVQKKIYAGEAQMIVRALPSDSVFGSSTNNASNAARNIDTEIRVMEGTPVKDRVRTNLGITTDIPDVAAAAVGQTDVVSVTVQSHDPAVAAKLANAYVQAYIDVRREQSVNSLLDAVGEVTKQVGRIKKSIEALDKQVADAKPSDRETVRASLADERQQLVDQQSAFQQRIDQLQVQASLQSGSAQMVRPSEVPATPVEPTPVRTGALALIVGLLLGLGAAFLADYLDDTINTPDELERATGGLPVLTTVPEMSPPDSRPIALSQPADPTVESYRSLRTALQFVSLEKTVRVIQVTSPLPGEGKTTTAANLAVLLAQTGQRVVLVDADLRRPRLHKVFGYDGSRGLTSALLGQPVLDLLFPVALGAGHLEVLAAGPIPTNPSETLGSERMRVLINELTKMFDTVVVDSAPVLPVTDAVVAARLADAVVLVALANQSTDRQVREAIGLMSRANAHLVGTVLNGVDPDRDPYGNGYGYGYGYTANTPETSEQSTQRFKKRR